MASNKGRRGIIHGPEDVDSSWVATIGYGVLGRGKRSQGIIVTFLDGFTCWYPGTEETQYRNFRRSKSKGKWVHRTLYELDYEELSGDTLA